MYLGIDLLVSSRVERMRVWGVKRRRRPPQTRVWWIAVLGKPAGDSTRVGRSRSGIKRGSRSAVPQCDPHRNSKASRITLSGNTLHGQQAATRGIARVAVPALRRQFVGALPVLVMLVPSQTMRQSGSAPMSGRCWGPVVTA
jgi:hypothetical protein